MIHRRRNRGFSILSVLLFIAGIIIALSIWTLSGKSNTSNNDKNVDVLATAIINEGLQYKVVFDQYNIGKPSDNQRRLMFSPNVVNSMNLLDPTNGARWEKVNSKALIPNAEFPKGYWAYNARAFRAAQIGTVQGDPAFLVTGINDTVCKKINLILHGDSTIPIFTDNDYEINDDIIETDAVSFNYIHMHYYLPTRKRVNGCVNHQNNPNDNFYFQVGQIN